MPRFTIRSRHRQACVISINTAQGRHAIVLSVSLLASFDVRLFYGDIVIQTVCNMHEASRRHEEASYAMTWLSRAQDASQDFGGDLCASAAKYYIDYSCQRASRFYY